MKGKYIAIILVILLLASVTITTAANDDSSLALAGKYLRDFINREEVAGNSDDNVAAEYHGREITASALELQRKTRMLLMDAPSDGYSDYELIHIIVEGMVMVEEAERLGLTVTQEEIDAMIQGQKDAYELPEFKAYLDDYCSNAEITLDEYYDMLAEIAPSYILKQKLRDEIGRQYCAENGLEFTKINPPQDMTDAIETYIEELFHEHKDEIVYYINVET